MHIKRPQLLIGALVATAAIGLLIVRYALSDTQCANPLRCDLGSAPARAATRSAGSGGGPMRLASKPLPAGPFDSIRGELEARAKAGDAEASYRLGHVIARCTAYESMSDNAFAEMIAKAAVVFGSSLRIFGRVIDDQDTLDLLLHGKDELDRTCAGTASLRQPGGTQDAHAWIERAAALGHTGAMAEYAEHAFTQFRDHADLLDHAPEVARRRELAEMRLEQALRAGEPTALRVLAKAHGKGGLLQRDGVLALAYWEAYRQTAEGLALPPAMLRLGDEHFRQPLDASQQRRAEQLALNIRSNQASPGQGR